MTGGPDADRAATSRDVRGQQQRGAVSSKRATAQTGRALACRSSLLLEAVVQGLGRRTRNHSASGLGPSRAQTEALPRQTERHDHLATVARHAVASSPGFAAPNGAAQHLVGAAGGHAVDHGARYTKGHRSGRCAA